MSSPISLHHQSSQPASRPAAQPPSPSTSKNSSAAIFSLHHQTIIERPPLSPSTAAAHSKSQNASTSTSKSCLTETEFDLSGTHLFTGSLSANRLLHLSYELPSPLFDEISLLLKVIEDLSATKEELEDAVVKEALYWAPSGLNNYA